MNNMEIIRLAVSKGANIIGSVSGGKDGQAMLNILHDYKVPAAALVHADLGSVEWPQSMAQCEKHAKKFNIPLHVVKRHDGRGLLEHMMHRLNTLRGTGKPFWPSSQSRYCTSDTKRDPINKFFRNYHSDFIISAEGIRAEESPARAKKSPLEIRGISSTYYKDMTVIQAIMAYKPGKRLALTWYPIFNYTLGDVWVTENMSDLHLQRARIIYGNTGIVPEWWPFHPAYVFGNDRVSCMFCILGSLNDLQVGAAHNPLLLDTMIVMEDEGESTFKNNFSLKQLK